MLDFRGKTKADVIAVMKKLWLRQLVFAVIVLGIGMFFLPFYGKIALAVGLGWALFDDVLIFGSTVRGYGVPPENLKKILVRFYAYRFATGVCIIGVMLGLKLQVLEAFVGFILLHIFLIFNLQNFTRRRN